MNVTDKPLAASGLHSFRYRGRYGWIMIGARDSVPDALNEAQRSTDQLVTRARLERWDGERYVGVDDAK